MRVKRDFDRVYDEQSDPWAIGAADDPRYDLYRERLLARVRGGRLLDIGCGLGAFLARFAEEFDELVGVETAAEAVRRGREIRPEIRFHEAAAEGLEATELDDETFDAIILSDVLYYLRPRDRATMLAWTASHLRAGGHALVAAWCPGGRYFEPDEFRELVGSALRSVDDVELPSQHVAIVARPKLRLVAFARRAPAGAVAVTASDDPEHVVKRAVAALPRHPSPELLRWRRRLGLRRHPTQAGDELVAVDGEETPAFREAFERRGFQVVSPEELAQAAG
ncbi:MAG TPA: class I SAM-dependent methyltransferase [Gaiellaceae bacterium]|jgi:SAM-dependent methyltransferase